MLVVGAVACVLCTVCAGCVGNTFSVFTGTLLRFVVVVFVVGEFCMDSWGTVCGVVAGCGTVCVAFGSSAIVATGVASLRLKPPERVPNASKCSTCLPIRCSILVAAANKLSRCNFCFSSSVFRFSILL